MHYNRIYPKQNTKKYEVENKITEALVASEVISSILISYNCCLRRNENNNGWNFSKFHENVKPLDLRNTINPK